MMGSMSLLSTRNRFIKLDHQRKNGFNTKLFQLDFANQIVGT